MKTILEVKRSRLGLRWRFRDHKNGQVINGLSQPYNRRRDLVLNILRVTGMLVQHYLPKKIGGRCAIVVSAGRRRDWVVYL